MEATATLVTDPIDSLRILFTNHINHPNGDFVKIEFHLFVLLAGGYLLLKKPAYLVMLIPIYVQKLFHDNYGMWSISGQYVIEFAPILAIGTFSVLGQVKNGVLKNALLLLLFAGSFGTSLRMMDNPDSHVNKSRIRFYQKQHYVRKYSTNLVHTQLNLIPRKAKVSAQSPFVPHLSLRENIYQFPIIKDADYIIYSEKEGAYPISSLKFEQLIQDLRNSKEWKVYFENQDLTILVKSNFFGPS